MRLTLRLIDNLRKILQGESIPYSSFQKTFADSLVGEGLLNVEYHGSRRNLRTHNAKALSSALPRYNEALYDLDAATTLLTEDNSRTAQATISGNSKTRTERSCPGFLVNSCSRMECMLSGRSFTIEPAEGSAIYIANWESFIPPSDALIVGVENMENFLKIRNQKCLFSPCLRQESVCGPHPGQEEKPILFVARYAFSSDLAQWLSRIPNRYLHFGDFDLAGINIFLTQFKPATGERGSFLIPPDIEDRLRHGSRQRYDEQYRKFHQLSTTDSELNNLIAMIHRYRRAYDQEGYIEVL